jgi:hypothetical protein
MERDYSEELGIDVGIILKWIIGNSVRRCGLVFFCKHINEPVLSVKGGEFLDYLSILLASQEALCSMKLELGFIILKTTLQKFISLCVSLRGNSKTWDLELVQVPVSDKISVSKISFPSSVILT